MRRVYPRKADYGLLVTLDTPMSHHDPSKADKSNVSLFNRQGQFVAVSSDRAVATRGQMALIAAQHSVPEEIAGIAEELSFPEFAATVLLRLFIGSYNSDTGTGLFAGMERYEYLTTRTAIAAIPAHSLRDWWDRLCSALKVPMSDSRYDLALLDLFSLPIGTQQQILSILVKQNRSAAMVARRWHELIKLTSEQYAEKRGLAPREDLSQIMAFERQAEMAPGIIHAEVPNVSANSVRHNLVRIPGFYHLMWQLGIEAAQPGQSALPATVESVFWNGGELTDSAPTTAHEMAHAIRAAYPLLDLVSGCAPGFFLGGGQLSVATWLVCAENREAFRDTPAYDSPLAQVSAFEMIDAETGTRHASPQGVGQMITQFETLMKGTQLYVSLHMAPQTMALTHGALIAAVCFALSDMYEMGGQGARGFGRYRAEWTTDPAGYDALRQEYEDYLTMNRDNLISGLMDGTMGTGRKVFS